MSANTFYVSTPIYYVNDRPHIGHAYTTVLGDVLARYHRLLGDRTFFLTGTDEHGQKVQQAAEQAGITPREQADRTVVRFQELWKRLEVTHDDFIRTTEERHTQIVQEILQDLFDRDEIYRAEYDGWYDVTSETFLTETDLKAGPPPEERPNVVRIQESNYFFRMSSYQAWLVDYIETHPDFIQPASRRNETLGFLRQPLQDLCISRPKSRLAWGIELPFDPAFVTYVWFDALVNYISAVGYRRDEERFASWWPVSVHLIGKDILTTHSVYWPTMLKAMGLPMPQTIFAHGWWLSGASKMSKSLGNVVNPMEMIDRFGVDPFRYFLLAEMTPGQDANFTEDAFLRRYNAELANDLGNLLSRVLTMIRRSFDGKLPEASADALDGPEEAALWTTVQHAVASMASSVEGMKLDAGLAQVIGAVRATNRYIEERQPWTLAKEKRTEELGTVLYTAAEALRVQAALLYPVMPGKMTDLRTALGMDASPPDVDHLRRWGVLQPGRPVGEGVVLFPRADRDDAAAAPAKAPAPATGKRPKGKTPTGGEAVEGVALISYDDFLSVDLRTAKVLEAERVEGADRLLRLQIEVGEERRQIVAGIAEHYAPEEVVGRTLVVVANLKPARIRGVESQGMLLAAAGPAGLRLVTIDGEVPSGVPVK